MFARFTTQPDATRKGLINDMIVALKAGGVWSKLEFLHVYAAADSQAARQNWKADAYNASAVGSPTFTADRGYTGNGSSSYVNTNFNPGDGGGPYQYALDSAHNGFWSRTDLAATVLDIGSRGSSTSRLSTILSRLSGDTDNFRVNEDGGGTVLASASSIGHFIARRSGASAAALFRNNLSLGTAAVASAAALQNGPWFVGSVNSGGSSVTFSARQYAAAHVVANLTDVEISALYSALSTYLTAIGA